MSSSYPLEDNVKCKENSSHVPKLRFKGYNDEWVETKTKELFENISIKNNSLLPVLAVTQDKGVILREDCGINIKYENESLKSYKLVQPGDFIISLRSFQGGLEYSDLKGIVSPAYTILNNTQEVSYVFFKYYFKTYNFIKSLNIAVEGIRDGKQISYNSFKDIKITFPSLPEQEKIASFLNLIDKKIEKQKELVELLKKYRRGLLSAIFEQKLRFKDFNNKWEYKTLKSVTTLIKDGTHSSFKDVNNGIPLLSAKDIESGKILVPTNCRKISIDDYNNIYKNYSLNKNDILITIVGTIGRIAIVEDITQKYALQRSVGILRIDDSANAKFISYVLQTEQVKRQFYSKVNQSAQGGIYLDTLGKITIEITDLTEQIKISSILSKLDIFIEREFKLLDLFKEYKKGLLQKLFI